MNRDLVFFVAGLSFGVVAGYFVFRAVALDDSTPQTVASASPERSQIGLERESEEAPLNESEVERLEARANADPDDADVRAELGRLYMASSRYEDAAAWLRGSLEIDPRDLDVRTQLALALLNLGRLEDAISTYEQTLRIDPDHPASLLGLGRVKLYVQQDIDGGLALWEKLVAVAPGSKEAESVREELEALQSAHTGG